jgi:hypothetical protein
LVVAQRWAQEAVWVVARSLGWAAVVLPEEAAKLAVVWVVKVAALAAALAAAQVAPP